MKRLPRGYKAQIVGTRMLQTVYTAEQMRKFAQRTLVGLSEQELIDIYESEQQGRLGDHVRGLCAIEAKLKEKNNG